MKIYILQRHDQALLDKSLQWTKNKPAADILFTQHRDVALNQLIELNTKDIDLRATIVECATDANGHPTWLLEAQNTGQVAKHHPSAA